MSTPQISIIYVTGRQQPMLDWTIRDLEAQARPDDRIELIVVDALGRRIEELSDIPNGGQLVAANDPLETTISVRAIAPKPSIWQGPARVTSCDWWALANARNTGIVVAKADNLVFMDDRCHLGAGWLDIARENASSSSPRVLAGSYSKQADGRLTLDHRRELHPDGKPNCGGGWLFTCLVSMPTEWALAVNGFEEGCDGLSMEDCIFGLNLQNAGYPIDFRADFRVLQERSAAALAPSYKRTDKGVSPLDKSHEALFRFGKRSRTEFTPDLRALRGVSVWPLPVVDPEPVDWYDGQRIRDM